MISRRRLLATGAVGAAALAGAGWWSWRRLQSPAGTPPSALSADAQVIVAAIVPAMVGDVLQAGADRATRVRETVSVFARAVAGLPPEAQREIGQLFALLALPVARRAFAGVASDWDVASTDEVSAFLDRWRDSRWALKRSAYDALHQLVLAAWYGHPRAWAAIGYDGPPDL